MQLTPPPSLVWISTRGPAGLNYECRYCAASTADEAIPEVAKMLADYPLRGRERIIGFSWRLKGKSPCPLDPVSGGS